MKIFFTQTAYPPSIGGAQIHLHQLAKLLSDHHEVKVACFWTKTRTDWLLGTTLFAPGGEPYELDGVYVTPIVYTQEEKIRLLPWVILYYIFQHQAIYKIAEILLPKLRQIGDEADIVHHGRVGREPLAYASFMLARELEKPFVLNPYHHPRWSSLFYRSYQRLYTQADAIFALTHAEGRMVEKFGVKREKIFVTGTGGINSTDYDPLRFRNHYGLFGSIVLFIGQKYPYKGFLQILKAAPLVWEKRPDIHFVFLGPRTNYSRRIFLKVRNPRVVELDTVSLEEKTSALAACDILCVPSTQESFGGVYIEAWQMGKPVIGSDIATVSEVIRHGIDGFVGPPSPSFLADAILQLINDPILRSQMGEAGKQRAEAEFSWSKIARKTELVYQKLLKG